MAVSSIKSDWATVLTEYVAGHRQEVVPVGWLTKHQIAELWGKSSTYANKLLRHLVKDGRAEKKNYVIRLPHVDSKGKKFLGHCRKVPHYRLTANKSPKS
jgi:hypothetical protein